MRTRALVPAVFLLTISPLATALPAIAQQNTPHAPSAQGTSGDKGAQTAAPPEKVRDVESEIKRETRRWRLGVRAGAAFNPNCFFLACNPKLDQSFPASSLGPMQNLHSEKRLISLHSISKRFTDFLQTTARGTGHLIWAPGQH
jgi:hypothetical protein